MIYGLFNKSNQVYLTHPRCGLWCTDDLAEAEAMLESCRNYFRAVGLDVLIDQIGVVEVPDKG